MGQERRKDAEACVPVCFVEPSLKVSSSFSVTLAVWAPVKLPPFPHSLNPSQGKFSCSSLLPCSNLSRICLGFPQERAMRWSWCRKHNLPDAWPGKTEASPSLHVGLTPCLIYLLDPVTCFHVFLFCTFSSTLYKSSMLNTNIRN